MKRLLSLIVALMMIAGALAEGFTPAMFLGSRGLVVMDENQLGGAESASESFTDFGDATFCIYSISSTGADSIVYRENGIIYAAFNMTAMFGGQGSDLSQVYADFCRAYEFDCYMAGTENRDSVVTYLHGDKFPLDAYEAAGGDVGMLSTSLDGFLESVAEATANRPEPQATPETMPGATATPTPVPTIEDITIVAFEQDGHKLTLTNPHYGNYGNIEHSLVFDTEYINDSDGKYRLNINGGFINGWDSKIVQYFDTPAGHKAKDTLVIDLGHAGITSFDEIESIELVFGYTDADYNFTEFDPVKVYEK